MNFKEILELIDKVAELGIGEIEIEQAGTRVRIQGKASPPQVIHSYIAESQRETASLHSSHAPAPLLPARTQEEEADAGLQIITSPIVGTFYRSPSPEAGPYVEVGTEVNPETVVCIIEAMKVMNEIKAEARGIITQVLVENAKPVEFGQPLFKIRPN